MRIRSLFASLCFAGAAAITAHAGVGTLVGDTYVTTVSPSSNFGGAAVLNVGGGASALVQFDLSNALSQLLSTTTVPGSAVPLIGRATLTVYANRAPASGNLSVAQNTMSWTENTVTSSTAPTTDPVATSIAVSAPGFVTLDITSIVQNWLNGQANDGLTLTCDTCVLVLDSKEATTTSHAAALDIDLATDFTGTLKKQLTLGSPGFTSLMSIHLTGTNTAGGRIFYMVRATDGGSQIATEEGVIQYLATANSITCTVQSDDKLHLGTVNSGCTPGFFNPGSQPGVSIFDNVSFSSPAPIVVHEVTFRIENMSGSVIRLEP